MKGHIATQAAFVISAGFCAVFLHQVKRSGHESIRASCSPQLAPVCCSGLHGDGGAISPHIDPAAEAKAQAWAERFLAQIPDQMPRSPVDETGQGAEPALTQDDLHEVRNAFADILSKYGPSARAYISLAICQLRSGDFEDAVHSFREALQLSPGSKRAVAGLLRATQLWNVSRSVLAQLPHGNRILEIRSFPVKSESRIWAVLYCRKDSRGDEDLSYLGDVNLTLYQRDGDRYQRIWQRKPPKQLDGEIMEAHLYVEDLNADRIPEVLLHTLFRGGSVEPAELEIFSWRDGRIKKVMDLDSSWPFWIEDLRHTGHWQVRKITEIGTTMCHGAMPWWQDVYDFRGSHFQLANRQFQVAFHGWIKKLREVLAERGDDFDIWEHLGMAYEIARRPGKALHAYRQAERVCAQLLAAETDPTCTRYYADQLKEIHRHIAEIRS